MILCSRELCYGYPTLACLDKLCFCGVMAHGLHLRQVSQVSVKTIARCLACFSRLPWVQTMGNNSVKTIGLSRQANPILTQKTSLFEIYGFRSP